MTDESNRGPRVQYAAITDLEQLVKEIIAVTTGRIALIYDPKLGWSATDELVLQQQPNDHVMQVAATTYLDWHRTELSEALAALASVRFLSGSSSEKLFRRPRGEPSEKPAPEGAAKLSGR